MKKFFLMNVTVLICMIVLPLAAVNLNGFSLSNVRQKIAAQAEENGRAVPELLPESVKVKAVQSGNVTEVSAKDYLIG